MKKDTKSQGFSDGEKALVEYFKARLQQKGVLKFPRDWHLKQLTKARQMLSGSNAPTLDDWKSCIDWLCEHSFWGDKTDHLARVEALWPQYILQNRKAVNTEEQIQEQKRRDLFNSLYIR